MKRIVVVAVFIATLTPTIQGDSHIDLNDVAVYVADMTGKVIPYPAPDGTKITIQAAGRLYSCTVQTVQGHKACSITVPNATAWKIVKVDWLLGVGYTEHRADTKTPSGFMSTVRRLFTGG